jgi:hypothetical protein
MNQIKFLLQIKTLKITPSTAKISDIRLSVMKQNQIQSKYFFDIPFTKGKITNEMIVEILHKICKKGCLK